jgi:hypothetical protein
MNTYVEMLDRLEQRIAIDGLTGHDAELARIGDLLVRTGILPAVAGILSDPTQPEVVRTRAFSRASRALRMAPTAPTALVA